jgi:hypothetical protein
MNYIVTHDGQAHQDELFAVAMLVAKYNIPYYRRDPTPDELENPEVCVVDVGGQYDPAKCNFDHHQDKKLPASIIMVAKFLGIKNLNWMGLVSIQDLNGAQDAADTVGVSLDDYWSIKGPLTSVALFEFSRGGNQPFSPNLIYSIGQGILSQDRIMKRREDTFDKCVETKMVNDVLLVIIEKTTEKNSTAGLSDWVKRRFNTDNYISVSPSQRGGYSIACIGKHNVNCSILEGSHGVTFIHGSGFLASVTKFEDACRLAEVVSSGNVVAREN